MRRRSVALRYAEETVCMIEDPKPVAYMSHEVAYMSHEVS